MKEVKLSDGSRALVDDEDFSLTLPFNWYPNHKGYAHGYLRGSGDGNGKVMVLLHDLVMHAEGRKVDHRDRNKRDCQKRNLRFATDSQNQGNRKVRHDSRSGLKGVTPHGRNWRARIMRGGKRLQLGTFASQREAALAYDSAARETFGEFALTNFKEAA